MAYLGVKTNHGVLVGTDGVEGINAISVGTTGSLLIGSTGADPAFSAGGVISVSAAGEVNWPLQPAFSAYNNASQTDVTGDGTIYTIQFNTEIFDQNGDFSSGTFTAPVSGRYPLGGSITLLQLTASHTGGNLRVATSNRLYGLLGMNWGAIRDNGNGLVLNWSCLADMDAADTASVTIQVSNGTKVVDLFGEATNTWTAIWGNLEC